MARPALTPLGCLLCALCTGCKKEAPPAPGPGYGEVMTGVARRFELAGKAIAGGRLELAAYELDEIGETFTEDLPHASPPKEGHPEVLPELAKAFLKTTLPEAKKALEARDKAKAAAAFSVTAQACNACHQASGHPFIEVPLVAGRAVPETEAPPAPPAEAAATPDAGAH
jgi:hypothetical protein